MKKRIENPADTPCPPLTRSRAPHCPNASNPDASKQTAKFSQLADFDLQSLLARLIKAPGAQFWTVFLTVFIALNLIFLYFGAHLMFGDHDWKYVKGGVPLDAGLFEGRFTQFIPINLVSYGEILPIINNTLGFFGYALGIALLARYWRLPQGKIPAVLFAMFAACSPYILSFMYFAFLVIPVLGWNAVIIGALLISEKEPRFSAPRTLAAALLYAFALGGYPPVANLFATALAARLLIAATYESATLKTLAKTYGWSVINFLIGALIYKLCLIYLAHAGAINESYYNLQTTPFAEWGAKFILTTQTLVKQFAITLPFIAASYKAAALVVTLSALAALCTAGSRCFSPRLNGQMPCVETAATATQSSRLRAGLLQLLLLIILAYAPLAVFFLSASTVETLFSPRIDFFGLQYFYLAMLALILKSPRSCCKNLGLLAAAAAIWFGALSLFEAEKVWKLGFDNELKLYRRIGKRFEASPNFNPAAQYIIVQDNAAPSLRARYYHTPYAHPSDDLLDISYVPGLNAAVMWNYYADPEYADKPAYVYRFRPDDAARHALQNAKPWPAPESVAVGAYWIMYFLSPTAIPSLQNAYLR